jgi:hypothetical protein
MNDERYILWVDELREISIIESERPRSVDVSRESVPINKIFVTDVDDIAEAVLDLEESET